MLANASLKQVQIYTASLEPNIDFMQQGSFLLYIWDRCSVGLCFVGLSSWKGWRSVVEASQMAVELC